MLVGTDFNPGIRGIGPKKALELVKKEKTLENILKKIDWEEQFEGRIIPAEEIYNFFIDPPAEDIEIKWHTVNRSELKKMMVEEFEFSEERVEKVIKSLEQTPKGLGNWLKSTIC